jgi:hypothetical protein
MPPARASTVAEKRVHLRKLGEEAGMVLSILRYTQKGY